jgi:hypothetical protein
MGITKRYRVDDDDLYEIEYRRESDGTYSIWCRKHPHNPVGGGVSDHHLYSSGQVCVSAGREPRTLDRAVAIAHVFMKSFSHWVRHGTPGRTGGRVSV